MDGVRAVPSAFSQAQMVVHSVSLPGKTQKGKKGWGKWEGEKRNKNFTFSEKHITFK